MECRKTNSNMTPKKEEQADNMNFITAQQIIEQYKEGRRDFSNITCKSGYLRETCLKDAVFRSADLRGTSLRGSDLTNAVFSNAKFFWSSLRYCNLKNTKFIGASMIWCCFENALLDNTDFRKADLSRSLFYNCERSRGNFDGANLFKVIWNEGDHSTIDLEEEIELLQRAGISLERILYIKSKIEERKGKLFGIPKAGDKPKGYQITAYSPDKPQKVSGPTYGQDEALYSVISEYAKRLEYKQITPKSRLKKKLKGM